MKNEIIEFEGLRWLVREAKSREEAINAISYARCSGSVGSKQVVLTDIATMTEEVLADVVKINSDGTERKPYTQAY